MNSVLIVGHVYVDVDLSPWHPEPKLRHGGVIHAARAAWALGLDFGVAFVAPDYLTASIDRYLRELSCDRISRVGIVLGAPNVVTYWDAKESSAQGYQDLLREERRIELDASSIKAAVQDSRFETVLAFPDPDWDQTALDAVTSTGKTTIVDPSDLPSDYRPSHLSGELVLMTSTSTALFQESCGRSVDRLLEFGPKIHATKIVLKENRGGAAVYSPAGQVLAESACVYSEAVHSVGVGDAFDVAFASRYGRDTLESAITFSAGVASVYASSTDPDELRDILRPECFPEWLARPHHQVRLPWDVRPDFPIYLAAPDFDYLDRRHIEHVIEALEYHNFRVLRPVQINGQLSSESSNSDRARAFDDDVSLLYRSKLLLAILRPNDSGTLVEMGIAFGACLPVVAYDSESTEMNPMVTFLPNVFANTVPDVVDAVFDLISRQYNG